MNDNVYVDVVIYYSEWSVDIIGDVINLFFDIGVLGIIIVDNFYFLLIGLEISYFVVFDFSDVVGLGVKNGSDFDVFVFIFEIIYELLNYWCLKVVYSYGLVYIKGVECGINFVVLFVVLVGIDISIVLNFYDVVVIN